MKFKLVQETITIDPAERVLRVSGHNIPCDDDIILHLVLKYLESRINEDRLAYLEDVAYIASIRKASFSDISSSAETEDEEVYLWIWYCLEMSVPPEKIVSGLARR